MTTPPTNISSLSPADMHKAEGPPKAWAVPEPNDPAQRHHVQNWLAHLDAGRLGSTPPCPTPETAKAVATREANARLFARLAGREA